MGRIQIVCRLALRDIRHRPVQSVLLLLVISAATGTLMLGLVLHGVVSQPYAQTKAATDGPDVVASSTGYPDAKAAATSFAALERAPGVTAHSGPYPVAWAVLRANGITAEAMAEGRGQARAAVDQPDVTEGTWVAPGGVVVERAFADALGVRVGDHLTLNGRRFRVDGIAVTSAVPVFTQVCFYGGCRRLDGRPPSFDTGLVWLTQTSTRSLATPAVPLTYYLNLRLKDPAAAPAFVSAHQPPATSGPPALTAWQSLSGAAATIVRSEQQVLEPASVLLALLAMATVAVVAGGRMAEQQRRVGLLKAAGGTPALTATILLAEHLVIALIAAVAGLAAGWLAAPLLTSPGASLVGSPAGPSLTPPTGLAVVVAAAAVVAAATLVPAVRAARMSAIRALNDTARTPRRRARLIGLSASMPVPLLLGLRLMSRRVRRSLLNAVTLAVTAATIVAVMHYHATVGKNPARLGPWSGPPDPSNARIGAVMLVITVVMALLAAASTVFITWATVMESRRFSGVVRSLGATPEQTVAGLTVAQLFPALAGALLGIPAGAAIYSAVQNGGPQGSPPAWWLAAMVLGMVVGVAALASIPARIGASHPVAEALGAET
jgi:ABC-type lipoprotein release transport system permease subunit